MSLEPIPRELAPAFGQPVTDVRHVRDAGARVATVAALRADATLPERSGGAVRLECHTQAGLGGGRLTWGAYGAEDNGMCFRVTGRTDGAWRRPPDIEITPYLFGGAGDYLPGQTAGIWDESKDSGGLRDNTAILAALVYCTAARKPLRIPAGYWLIDHTQVRVTHHNIVRGDSHQQTIMFAKLDAPVAIGAWGAAYVEGYHAYSAELSNLSIITYHTGFVRAVFLLGSVRTKIDIAVGGAWAWMVDSPLTTQPIEVFSPYGHNYFPDFNIRTMPLVGGQPFPAPAYPISGFRNEVRNEPGGLTGGIVKVHAQNLTEYGIYVNRGISLTVEAVTEGTNIASVFVKNATDVHVTGGYSELTGNSVVCEDCNIVTIGGQNSTPIRLVRCLGITLAGQAVPVDLVDCRAPVLAGGLYYNGAGYGSAVKSNNVGLVTLSASVETGIAAVVSTGYSQADGSGLLLNGDLSRWVAGAPWGWEPNLSAPGSLTKCGLGCSDTTAPTGSRYSLRWVGFGVRYVRLTPPIGEQYGNTYVAVQCKVRYVTPLVFESRRLMIRLSRYREYNENPSVRLDLDTIWTPLTGPDAGWYLVSAMLPIEPEWCASGLGLQIDSGIADIYIADLDARFGVANQRLALPPRYSADRSVELLSSGNLRWSAAATAEVDPWAGQAVLDGDRIDLITPTAGGTLGWVRVGGAWKTCGSVAL